jgi:ParB family chromosome partitioning protein
MNKNHHLKTEKPYYDDILDGVKDFELRKNDRDYRVGDLIWLEEVIDGIKTGRQMSPMKVKYIFHGGRYGLKNGYCILSFERK